MGMNDSIVSEVFHELKNIFAPPRDFLNILVINGAISFVFFFVSYRRGTFDPKLLPIAAATIMLWTLADASITNHLLYYKPKTVALYKQQVNLKRFLLVKNLTMVIVSIPMTVVFGLLLVAITNKWSEMIYGTIVAIALIWGWLGISNALSTRLPFEMLKLNKYLKNRRVWLRYGILYGLPWILLPIYAVIISLPFILLGWTKATTGNQEKFLSWLLLLSFSVCIWLMSFRIANKAIKRPDSKLVRMISPKRRGRRPTKLVTENE